MSRTFRYPRNEKSRADRIAIREISIHAARNHKSRNDAIANNPYGAAGITIALTGTAIAGGITEEMVVAGGDTVIITLANDSWHPDLGADNAITTEFLAAITGDLTVTGWNDEVTLVHGDLTRNSGSVVTLVIPASASYAIAAVETVTVAPPNSSVQKGAAPVTASFTVTEDVLIALTGTMVAGGVLESEIVTGGVNATLVITLTGDTWVATLGDDNAITTAFLAAITGNLADAAGWNAQVSATLAHGDLTRDSDTALTLVGPAVAGYAITSGNETVTVAPPSDSVTGGIVPAVKTFLITEGS